jgi:hypothetical protein
MGPTKQIENGKETRSLQNFNTRILKSLGYFVQNVNDRCYVICYQDSQKCSQFAGLVVLVFIIIGPDNLD